MPCTDRVEAATVGDDEGIHGGAAAEEPRPAEPEATAPAMIKRATSGIEVLDSVSASFSIEEMSLSSKPVAAAAQGLLVGLPMLNLWTPPTKESPMTANVGLELQSKVEGGFGGA